MNRLKVKDIREEFISLLAQQRYVTDKTGVKMLEIINASFIADEPSIFGKINEEYIEREIGWYESMSLNVYDIPAPVPAIWEAVSDEHGFINSNYGWCIWHKDNYRQYEHVLRELQNNPFSRRGVMIYTRPSMWLDYNQRGMSDFMCTNAVQYVVRDGALEAVVQMRSNDVWAGYRNDFAWQEHVHKKLAGELKVKTGSIYWNVGSLHCYQKNFWMIDAYAKTGKMLTKKEYESIS